MEEIGAVELFVVGAMTALDAAVVLFASRRVANQLTVQGLEEAFIQGHDLVGVVTTELASPIGLEGDPAINAVSTEPQEDKEQEGQAIGAVVVMGIDQETQASTAVTGTELVTRQAAFTHVVPALGAQSTFVENIFDVGLEQGQGEINVPGPLGWVHALPPVRAHQVVTFQDVADGMGRDGETLAQKIQSQPAPTIACGSAGLYKSFNYPGGVRRGEW